MIYKSIILILIFAGPCLAVTVTCTADVIASICKDASQTLQASLSATPNPNPDIQVEIVDKSFFKVQEKRILDKTAHGSGPFLNLSLPNGMSEYVLLLRGGGEKDRCPSQIIISVDAFNSIPKPETIQKFKEANPHLSDQEIQKMLSGSEYDPPTAIFLAIYLRGYIQGCFWGQLP